jgi:hypothetical protein
VHTNATTTSAAEPWFVASARAAKADLIVRGLMREGVTADQAARFTDDQQYAAAEAVGKPLPSRQTWRLVVEMLAGSRAERALCPTCGCGDPQGDPGPRKPYQHPGRCAR